VKSTPDVAEPPTTEYFTVMVPADRFERRVEISAGEADRGPCDDWRSKDTVGLGVSSMMVKVCLMTDPSMALVGLESDTSIVRSGPLTPSLMMVMETLLEVSPGANIKDPLGS